MIDFMRRLLRPRTDLFARTHQSNHFWKPASRNSNGSSRLQRQAPPTIDQRPRRHILASSLCTLRMHK